MKMENNLSLMSASEFRHLMEETYARKPVAIEPNQSLDPVLYPMEQATIDSIDFQDEHHLIVMLTPRLEELCVEAGLQFVNSENEKWIHTLLAHNENYLKPDGCSSLPGLYIHRPEYLAETYGKLREELKQQRTHVQFLFGHGIWALRDMQVAVWEFKVRISPEDVGVAYNYVAHLSRGDKTNKYYVILGDRSEYYIIMGYDGEMRETKKGKWVEGGSKQAILTVLNHRNRGLALLEYVCSKLQVKVTSFVGAGALGRCFAVVPIDDSTKAKSVLKLVLTQPHADSHWREQITRNEFRRLCDLREQAHVIQVNPDSLTSYRDENANVVGLGYLMYREGSALSASMAKRMIKKVLLSLQSIHLTGNYHGDSRIANAVLVEDVVVWVDLTLSNFVGSDMDDCMRNDLRLVIASVYGKEKLEDQALQSLLLAYRRGQYDVLPMVSYLKKTTANFEQPDEKEQKGMDDV